jgi:serine/threonine-protein kinase
MNVSALALQRPRAPGAARPLAATTDFDQVGPWQLVRLIGSGAWSRVYQARPAGQRDAPAAYAVKLVHAQADAELGLALLRTEAMLGRAISHPHVIPVLAHHLGQPPCFLVMPLLEGVTLRQMLQTDITIPVARALWIVRQIGEGLSSLHERRWLHADVKPENIHVAPNGHATLLDLGLARSQQAPGCVFDRAIVGTLRYTAPEWLVSNSHADARSDLYSLGAVLYEILAGAPPFAHHDPLRLAAAHLEELPRDLREIRPELPKELCELVQRLLAKEKLRRAQSASELVVEICRSEIASLAQRAA